MKKVMYFIFILQGLLLSLQGCLEKESYTKTDYHYIRPEYDMVRIVTTGDTLRFLLNDSTYNQIETMNLFIDNDKELVSFFDQRSISLNIYDIISKNMIKKILLNKILKIKTPEKLTAYVINMDSIFVGYKSNLYLINSNGKIRRTVPFVREETIAKPVLTNGNLPVVIGTKVFTTVKPSGMLSSVEKCRDWKTMYEFNLSEKKAKVFYNFPSVYHIGLYSYPQLLSSFCFSKNSRFIISYAVDTNIYETDFMNYNVSYFAKSKNQKSKIGQLKEGSNAEDSYKQLIINHVYGNIYYDETTDRYLRISREAISAIDYETKKGNRKQSIIIMDRDFRIIGESPVSETVDLSTLIFSRTGDMYARINRSDEYAVHFVKFKYSDSSDAKALTRK